MKLAFILLAAVPLAAAHTHITNLFINGVDQVSSGSAQIIHHPCHIPTLHAHDEAERGGMPFAHVADYRVLGRLDVYTLAIRSVYIHVSCRGSC